jgi:hypothetical protein
MRTRDKLRALGVAAGLGVLLLLAWRAFAPPPVASTSTPSASPGADAERGAAPTEPGPVRPRTPPVQGRDSPPVVDEPALPADADALRLAAYQEALAREAPRPGEQAFRAMVSAFMDHNHRLAEQQAQAEGLGLDEVEELTFLGLMAQESQRWPDVEQLLGGPVDAEKRTQAETMLRELDGDFEQSMRDLVADGASVEDRWALIRSFERDYRDRYFELTGMDEDLLDDLLAGDASRKYAPGSTPPPEDMPPNDAEPAPLEARTQAPAR